MTASNVSAPVALFQPPTQVGLGHMSRLAAIALALQSRQPDTRSMFAIEGCDYGFLDHLGFPSITLPSATLGDSTWSSWSAQTRAQLIRQFCQSLLASLNPSVAIFDCVPHARLAALCHRRQIPICFVARKTKLTDWYEVKVRPLLDAAASIIVPHTPEEFVMPRQWESKTHYVGDVVRERRTLVADTDMDALSAPRVVITGGGGDFPGTLDFYNLTIEACANCRAEIPNLSSVVVTGPLFKDWSRLRLNGSRLLPFHWDMPGLYDRANLIVCQAGYNTVAEVLRSGKPTISIPGERPLDDQLERARLAASRNLSFTLLDKPSLAELSATIASRLRSGTPHVPSSLNGASDGAAIAAGLIASIIHSQKKQTRVSRPRQNSEL